MKMSTWRPRFTLWYLCSSISSSFFRARSSSALPRSMRFRIAISSARCRARILPSCREYFSARSLLICGRGGWVQVPSTAAVRYSRRREGTVCGVLNHHQLTGVGQSPTEVRRLTVAVEGDGTGLTTSAIVWH